MAAPARKARNLKGTARAGVRAAQAAHKEALEHQAATAEILRIIARSPKDTAAVFGAITRAAMRLIPDSRAALLLARDGMLHYASHSGVSDARRAELAKLFPVLLDRTVMSGAAILDKRIIHVPDIRKAGKRYPRALELSRVSGYRAILNVPLMRGGEAIGCLNVSRVTPGPFTKKQISLVKTFADQGLIAMENARLFNETKEALGRQTATAEILNVIASSPTDTQPVFDAIARNTSRLCKGMYTIVTRYDGALLHLAAEHNPRPGKSAAAARQFPRAPGRDMPAARAILERAIVHIADVAQDGELSDKLVREVGAGSFLAVPMLHDGAPIGSIGVSREQRGPFPPSQIDLVKVFADQAVIAIRNADFLHEIQQRNAELKKSLEFQGATGEILASLSSSVTDTKPVFDAIVRNVLGLFGTQFTAVFQLRGEMLELAALKGHPDFEKRFVSAFPQPVDSNTLTGKVLQTGKLIQVTPIIGNAQSPQETQRLAQEFDYNSMMIAPMIREGKTVGAIATAHRQAIPFDAKQVTLLKAFADQAVIAIENARLFKELEARNRDLGESLEQQTATSEILGVISSSPTDVQPVFDAIVKSAHALCEAAFAGVILPADQKLKLAASYGLEAGDLAKFLTVWPRPVSSDPVMGRAFVEGRPVNVPDLAADPDYRQAPGHVVGVRSILGIPMLREGKSIGAIGVWRREVRPFSSKQIALLQTFADQAVIAIENVRLFNETKEALERQTATAEILKVISSSPTEVQPVFDAIVQSGLKLFSDAGVAVVLRDGDQVSLAAVAGRNAERLKTRFPFPLTREYMHGLAILDRKLVDIPDAQAYKEGPLLPGIRNFLASGSRAQTVLPMIRGNVAIGAISVTHEEARQLTDKQLALFQTFADQAVIAIENVRLFNETKEALERQTAVAQVLKTISQTTFDLQAVFNVVVENATKLCRGDFGYLFRREGEVFQLLASAGGKQELVEYERTHPTGITRKTLIGRMALERRLVHIPDVFADPDYEWPANVEHGVHTVAAVPIFSGDEVVGAIGAARFKVEPFSAEELRLFETFADQAAIAIDNVRLFNETKEALEQQTATSAILGVISSSPTDLRPVFDAILGNATTLCEAHLGLLHLFDGEYFRTVAHRGANPEYEKWIYGRGRFKPQAFLTELVSGRKAVHVADIRDSRWYLAGKDNAVKLVEVAGARSFLAVPLLKDGQVVGTITIYRPEVRPFTDKQITLLSTFADQAVIAIENVRLFNETKEALEQQTATAEVLKLISRTTFELDKVLQALLDNAARLSGAVRAAMLRPDGEGNFVPVVTYNYDPDGPLMRRMRERPIHAGRDSINGRALLEKRPIHVADVLADPEYGRQDLVERERYRTVLAVPMLRDGEAIGLLALTKGAEVDPFTEKQMEVVTTFADQAVIAIENVRLFQEIKDKTREVEVANKHKSEFLANMSHELRTPLNAIIGFSEVLIEKMFGEVNEKQADYLKDIHESGRHLLSLINDVLDLSKIEAGRMELELGTFHLPTAISNAMTLVRERAQRHGIHLASELDPALGELNADERKVKQILLNLLSNAVKFTPDGGRVHVSAACVDSRVEVSVRDTGIGIAPEDHAAVFEEFKQVGRDALKKAEGTGLGLTLTKRLVELHGGEIRLESVPGKGSTFSFTLPLR
jgi:GAF domain-containing protein